MNRTELIGVLSKAYPKELSEDLADSYLEMRRDLASGSLGRSSPGKFVETVVQVLQHMKSGAYEAIPNVDGFLRDADNKAAGLPDSLRVCGARVARAMYSLRSKRNIVHKGEVDPNGYDLRLLHACAQWIMAELVRLCSGVSMQKAGELIDQITAPIGPSVEEIDGRVLVLVPLTIREEALVLLLRRYPSKLTTTEMEQSMDRRNPRSVKRVLRELWQKKLVAGGGAGYTLTQTGLSSANLVAAKLTANSGRST